MENQTEYYTETGNGGAGMRITRVMAIVLIGVLLILGACASPAPAPTTPTPAPTTPTPAPTTPTPAPTTPTPAPTTTTPAPTTQAPTPTTPAPAPATPAPAPPPTTPTPAPTTPAPAPPPTTPTPATPNTTPATPPAVQGANEVWIVGREFRPFSITVPVGTKVTWTSKSDELHTITSDTGLFEGSLYGGQSFSYTFTEPGTFSYHCEPHVQVGMVGTVFVK